jgi:hypothetical protein
MLKSAAIRKSPFNDPLKEATIVALKRVIGPMIDLIFGAGVTVHEFNQLVRERAVRTAATRQLKINGRVSKSRVAIATGLPRSEVARILESDEAPQHNRLGQHPARKLLAAWFDDPRYLSANGDPAILPIFGKRRSFEQLVSMHSGGIPVRAMLDELTQIDAVERLPSQRVKAKTRIPILTGLTGSAITAIGERIGDLLETLTKNLSRTSRPLFEGTALIDDADLELVSLVRKEIAEQGLNFIGAANSLLSRSRGKPGRLVVDPQNKCRLGVTVYYFQDDVDSYRPAGSRDGYGPRKNLQRRELPTIKKVRAGADRSTIRKGRS